jgi:tRNA (cytidine/uridine-2'-O-)-methyltransferase
MPLNIVLYQPEIPPNTGNIIRLAANTGAHLHLIEPLGFELDDTRLRRAGLDYREWARVQVHPSLDACLAVLPDRVWALSTRGARPYTEVDYAADDVLLFGPETRGLPREVLAQLPSGSVLRVPMQPGSRSINLSNAVAIVLFEAWRQQAFAGADGSTSL